LFADLLVFTARRGRTCPPDLKARLLAAVNAQVPCAPLNSTEAYADRAAADELPTIS